MKKILGMLATALIGAIIVIATGVGFNSCSEGGLGSYIKGPQVDSAQVVDIIEDYLNPEFDGIDAVLVYKDFTLAKQQIESTFIGLTDKQIVDISTVIIKKGIPLSIKSIYDEYVANKDVYDNLPAEISNIVIEPKDTVTVMEALPTLAVNPSETSYTSKDTVIDGKRATVTTKIEKYE